MPEEIYSQIGEQIRRIRDSKDMSQDELAQKLGVTPNTISRWETATYRPTVADIDNVARVFNLPLSALLPSDERSEGEINQKLLSATGDLPKEDIEELERYAEFIRYQKTLSLRRRRSGRPRGTNE